MGTRNITRVVYKEHVAVEQYCQWDGYPTGQGCVVMLFVQKYYPKIEDLKDRLDRSHLFMTLHGDCSFTGAPYEEGLYDKLCKASGEKYFKPDNETIGELLDEGKVTLDDATRYIIQSRDSGPQVLYWLMERCEKGANFYTEKYLNEINDELDWQIEGLFTIDLDKETVTINYHGRSRTYGLADVAGMTEKQIEDEMKNMEKMTESEE